MSKQCALRQNHLGAMAHFIAIDCVTNKWKQRHRLRTIFHHQLPGIGFEHILDESWQAHRLTDWAPGDHFLGWMLLNAQCLVRWLEFWWALSNLRHTTNRHEVGYIFVQLSNIPHGAWLCVCVCVARWEHMFAMRYRVVRQSKMNMSSLEHRLWFFIQIAARVH